MFKRKYVSWYDKQLWDQHCERQVNIQRSDGYKTRAERITKLMRESLFRVSKRTTLWDAGKKRTSSLKDKEKKSLSVDVIMERKMETGYIHWGGNVFISFIES